MNERKIDVLCLQETKVAAMTQYVVEDVLFVVLGHGEARPEYAGVAFAFSKRSRPSESGLPSQVSRPKSQAE